MRPSPNWASASGDISNLFSVPFVVFMALDSFLARSSRWLLGLFDRYRSHATFRLRPNQIDRQQSILQVGARHFHSIRQDKRALKLARCDTAVDVLPAFVVRLTTANDELVLLYSDFELVARETGDRKGNAQTLGTVPVTRNPFDVVGWIAVRRFPDSIKHTLDFVEAKKKRTRKRWQLRHDLKALFEATLQGPYGAPAGRNASASTSLNMVGKGYGFKELAPRRERGHGSLSGPGMARSASAASWASWRWMKMPPMMKPRTVRIASTITIGPWSRLKPTPSS